MCSREKGEYQSADGCRGPRDSERYLTLEYVHNYNYTVYNFTMQGLLESSTQVRKSQVRHLMELLIVHAAAQEGGVRTRSRVKHKHSDKILSS